MESKMKKIEKQRKKGSKERKQVMRISYVTVKQKDESV